VALSTTASGAAQAQASGGADGNDFSFEPPDPIDTSKWDATIKPYAPIIQAAAEKYGIPPQLVAGVIRTESNGNAKAVSPTGAQGLMQIEPDTGKGLGLQKPFDPADNIDKGTAYLAQMYQKFGNWNDALRAYNEGPHTVASDLASDLGNITGFHTPAYTEYPTQVLAHYQQYGGDLKNIKVDPGSLAESFANGATLGFLPQIKSGIDAGVGTLFGQPFGQTYAKDMNEPTLGGEVTGENQEPGIFDQGLNAFAKNHPVENALGQFAGSLIPSSLAGGLVGSLGAKAGLGAVTGGPTSGITNPLLRFLARSTGGAVQGGTAAAVTSPLNNQESPGTQAELGAGTGALMSGVLGPAAGGAYGALKNSIYHVPNMGGAVGPATAALAKIAEDKHGIPLTAGNIAGYQASSPEQNEAFTAAQLKLLGYNKTQPNLPVGERTAILNDKGQAVAKAAAAVPIDYSGPNAVQLKTDLSDIYSGFKHLDEADPNDQSVPAVRRSVGRERVKQVEDQLDAVAAHNKLNNGSASIPGGIISDMLAMPSKESSGGVVGRLLASANPEARRMGQLLQTALTNAQVRSGAGSAALDNLTNAKAEYKMANVVAKAAAEDPLTGTISPQAFLKHYYDSTGDADVKFTPRQQELATIAETFLTGKKNPAPQSIPSHLREDSLIGGPATALAHYAGGGPILTGGIGLAAAGKAAYDTLLPQFEKTQMYKQNLLSKLAGGPTSLRPGGLNHPLPDMRNALAQALASGVSQAAGPSSPNLLQQYFAGGGGS
jgi:hypothetical protein